MDCCGVNGEGENLACLWGQGTDRVVKHDVQMAACGDNDTLCGHFLSPCAAFIPSDTSCHSPALDLWASPRGPFVESKWKAQVFTGQMDSQTCSLGGNNPQET